VAQTSSCATGFIVSNDKLVMVKYGQGTLPGVRRTAEGCQTSVCALDFPWICYQNPLCSWSLKNMLLSLSIFRRPWKFLHSCEIVYYWNMDYFEHSRIKIKQCNCNWTE